MNIAQLTNHVKYDGIFDRNTINGKIQWCKIACDPDLPAQFIDQYFSKLKPFGIERLQKLNDDIISQHIDELNWYSLLKYQFISEEILKENVDKITKQKLWWLLLKTQKLSYEFLVDNLEKYKSISNISTAIYENDNIDESVKSKISSLISS